MAAASFAEHDAFFDDADPAGTATPTSIDPEADAFFTDAAPIDAPADALLRRLRDFTVHHAQQLADMRESMADTLSEAWSEDNDCIAVSMTAADPLPITAMVNTDNAQFNKVAAAIAHVVHELNCMKDIADSRFYAPLTQFGHKYSEHVLAAVDTATAPAGAAASSSSSSTLSSPPTAPSPPSFTPPTSLSQLPTLEQEFGSLLPVLQDLANFITRLFALTTNLVTQLGCLYHERQKLFLSTYRHVRLEPAFDAVGLACRLALSLDLIINDNEMIDKGWAAYKKMIKYVRNDTAKYEVQVPSLRLFESLLLTLDKQILSVSIFQSLLELPFGSVDSSPAGLQAASNKALIEGNKVLYEQFNLVIKSSFKRLTHALGAGGGAAGGAAAAGDGSVDGLIGGAETYDRSQLVDLYGLYALFRFLFKNSTKVDKKLFNELWLLQRRVPCVFLFGRALFFIPEFLGKYAPIDAKSVVQPIGKNILTVRTGWLQDSDDAFASRIDDFHTQLAVWLVRMESAIKLSSSTPVHSVLTTRSKLLLTGILLARSIRELLTSNIYLHLRLNVAFRARNIRSVAVGCEMLKSIQQCYVKRQGMIGEHFNLIIGQATFVIRHVLQQQRKRLNADIHQHTPSSASKQTKSAQRSMELDGKLDQLAALSLTHSLLEQPPTPARLTLLLLSVQVALGEKLWGSKSGGGDDKGKLGEEVRYQLWKLQLLVQYQQHVDAATNCSFLYWVPNLVPVFLSDVFSNPQQVNRLQSLVDCFQDVLLLFAGCELQQRQRLKHEYEQEILHYFNDAIILPLCREVETDLRLHIHSVVLSQLSLRNTMAVRDLSKFLNIKPLRFFSSVIDLRLRVSHYLDYNFYNLNTVALHDWRVYAEMRNLALEKYSLQLAEVHLPGTSHYSEKLDILEIMRHIHVFVSRYNYNMNTQIFIQRALDQKHISSISIYHISDSLRTHGTGVMNTTINFTYQFLARKFRLFSEFLFDEHIKSKLIKLGRQFRDDRQRLNSRFPYDWADRLNREVRKLGVSDDGSTFIDQFRRQITEIGNALGYVRMVRSGGLHFVSQGIKFIPDLNSQADFEAEVKEEQLPHETLLAARNVNAVLSELTRQFTSHSSYFSMLVDVFLPVFSTAEHRHLLNFHLIIPSLMLSYVERLKDCKEKMSKQTGRQETAFTDDGFALGIAYILRVLQLDTAFDSLHWFDSVEAYSERKRAELAKEMEKYKSPAPSPAH